MKKKQKIPAQEKPWMKHLGKLKHLRGERGQIEKRIEQAFERIDRDMWPRFGTSTSEGLANRKIPRKAARS